MARLRAYQAYASGSWGYTMAVIYLQGEWVMNYIVNSVRKTFAVQVCLLAVGVFGGVSSAFAGEENPATQEGASEKKYKVVYNPGFILNPKTAETIFKDSPAFSWFAQYVRKDKLRGDFLDYVLGFRDGIEMHNLDANGLPSITQKDKESIFFPFVIRDYMVKSGRSQDAINRAMENRWNMYKSDKDKPLFNSEQAEIARLLSTNNSTHVLEMMYEGLGKAIFGEGEKAREWAQVMITQEYLHMDDVKEIVSTWRNKHNYNPYPENMEMLAFTTKTLKPEGKILVPKDKEKTALYISLFRDYYNTIEDDEKVRILYNQYAVKLKKKGDLPNYAIVNGDKTLSVPPINAFNSAVAP